jgi:hypothetical protein
MTYAEWFEEHAKKHAKIVNELQHLSDNEVIDYFDFDNMKIKHPDFCPLYPKDEMCHEMKNLNCYLCACMHFRFSDSGIDTLDEKTRYSYCSIDSKNSRVFEDDNSMHNDCSNCKVPHKKHVIQKYFSRDWKEMMKECNRNPSL